MASKEKVAEASSRHYEANKEKKHEQSKRWAAANPERTKAICRASYHRNADKYRIAKAERLDRRRVQLHALKAKPCMDCGGSFPPCVMDFDHRDPSTKRAGVSNLAMSGSEVAFLAEVAKCDLVCANCHRVRTYTRVKETNAARAK